VLVVAPREVGRFHKRPGQILVAALLVVLRFALSIAQALRIDNLGDNCFHHRIRPVVSECLIGFRASHVVCVAFHTYLEFMIVLIWTI
jgi:hypothetical protein